MLLGRTAVAVCTAVLILPFAATAAYAAPPGNDTVAGATALGSLPQTVSENTSDATTDALDASVNAYCGAPFTNASVWFTYTDVSGAGFLADMSASDYTGGFIVTAGDPANGNLVACGPEQVGVRGDAGTTYYIVAFSDTATNGGNLSASFTALPPAPTATITVDPRGVAYKNGSARVSGTYSCTNADGFSSDVEGTLSQTVGRTKISGFFFDNPLVCDGSVHTWAAVAFSDTALFAGGKAASVSVAFACGLVECTVVEADATIQLSRNGK
jgi:hypothetical protein